MATIDEVFQHTEKRNNNASSSTADSSASPPITAAPPSSSHHSQYVTQLFQQLVQATKLANAMPEKEDINFACTLSPAFQTHLQRTRHTILNLLGNIHDASLHSDQAIRERNRVRQGEEEREEEEEEEDVVLESRTYTSLTDSLDQYAKLTQCIDYNLEQVDLYIDRHKNRLDPKKLQQQTQLYSSVLPQDLPSRSKYNPNTKPQKRFSPLSYDTSHLSWIPLLETKPNAMVPLIDYEEMRRVREAERKALTSGQLGNSLFPLTSLTSSYPHPYTYEITHIKYPDWAICSGKEILPGSLQHTPVQWISTLSDLHILLTHLSTSNLIAIDLEHHNHRSYIGLTCLMQISTREMDFLIDTIELREHMSLLLPIFTDPSIVKILHGADMDIQWLQRDMGLYIVNMFDTGQASRILEMQSFGLAYLLSHYCDVHTDKKYQLSDWRIRPLPAEQLLYARMDTHYLLYIYDRMKNELVERSQRVATPPSIPGIPTLLSTVLSRSNAICASVYEKEEISIEKMMESKNKISGSNAWSERQVDLYGRLLLLRDNLARTSDESLHYIMPNTLLLSIVLACPNSTQELMNCASPFPAVLRSHAQLVLDAVQASANPQPLPQPQPQPQPQLSMGQGQSIQTPMRNNNVLAPAPVPAANNVVSTVAPTPATSTIPLFAALSTSTPLKESPLLSIEQLYESSGWMAASRVMEMGLSTPRSTVPFSLSTSPNLITPLHARSSMASMLGPAATTTTTTNSNSSGNGNVAIPVSPYNAEMGEEAARRTAEVYALLRTPPDYLSSTSFPSAHLSDTPLRFQSIALVLEEKDNNNNNNANANSGVSLAARAPSPTDIQRTPNTGEPAHSFLSPSPPSLRTMPPINQAILPTTALDNSNSGDAQMQGEEQGQGDDMENEEDKDSSPLPSTTTTAPAGLHTLPRSMREIYKISNENRRAKKHKLKLQGDEEEEQGQHRKSSKVKERHIPDSMADVQGFLSDIGWSHAGGGGGGGGEKSSSSVNGNNGNGGNRADQGSKPGDKKARKNSSNNTNNTTNANANTIPFMPFDYSNATLPPTTTTAQGYFNPYGEESSTPTGISGGKQQQKVAKGHMFLKGEHRSIHLSGREREERAQGKRGGGNGFR